MVSFKEESPIYNVKISSVGPGKVTGEDAVHEPTNMDLAMKLHYLRGVYYFKPQAFRGLTIMNIKETFFLWLNHCYLPCGRLRRYPNDDDSSGAAGTGGGRPFIKCNDCGVRLVEAECNKSLDEWLVEAKESPTASASLHKLLVPNQVIGPELPFSPLVFVQLTNFKCGGRSVGLSWAHVLGDAFFAAEFMSMWSKIFAGDKLDQPLKVAQLNVANNYSLSPTIFPEDPLSLKRVGPVGDHWITPNTHKMETFSFQVSSSQLKYLQSKISEGGNDHQSPAFECLCAAIWQSIAKVRDGPEPKIVTICQSDPKKLNNGHVNTTSQAISIVKASFSIAQASPKELGLLLATQAIDETKMIEEAMGRDHGLADFIIYGANLTFVNLENVPFYSFEVRGQKPVMVNYDIDGIGEEGVVLVLPAPRETYHEDGIGGRIVNVTLPENQVLQLKYQLKKDWSIA